MPRCDISSELLVAYADGYLVSALREHVELHLQTCKNCRRQLADFAEVDHLLRESSPPIDDPIARSAIHAHIDGTRTGASNGRWNGPYSLRSLGDPGDAAPAYSGTQLMWQKSSCRSQNQSDLLTDALVNPDIERPRLGPKRFRHSDIPVSRRLSVIFGSLLVVLILAAAAPKVLSIVEQALDQDPGTQRILVLGLGKEVDLSHTVSGFTVAIKRVYADPNQIVIGYTISGPPGREFVNFHPFDLADSTAPTLTNEQGHQFGHAPLNWGAGIEDEVGGYVEVFDATSIMNFPQELSLRLDIPAITAIERVEDRVSQQYPAASSCEPGFCRFSVPGPFVFDLMVPFEPGRAAELHQVSVVDGKTVTLERVATTPTGTRVDLNGVGPNAEVELLVDGESYALQPPGAISTQATDDPVHAFTSPSSLLDEHGEWTLVVKTEQPAYAPPEKAGSKPLVFHFSFQLP